MKKFLLNKAFLRPFLSVTAILVMALGLWWINQNFPFKFGLDLSGGTQLSYQVDLSQVPEERHKEILDGVQEVMERRVNGLGVAEPVIYSSKIGDSQAIVVELAGISDIEEAKAIVGKTIQLEFKEENPNPEDKDLESRIMNRANSVYASLQQGKSFSDLMIEEEAFAKENNWILDFESQEDFQEENTLSEPIKELVKNLELKRVSQPQLIEDGYTLGAGSNLIAKKGIVLVELLDRQTNTEEKVHEAEVQARHILVSYKGAERSEATRSQSEAKKEAERILNELKNGASFDTLAKEFSDDAGSGAKGGDLGFFGKGKMTAPFEEAAFRLNKNELSDLVESEFGYHIIEVTDKKEAYTENITTTSYRFNKAFYHVNPSPWSSEVRLNGEHFKHADVQINPADYQPTVSIAFTEEGKKIFAEMTEKNIGKSIGIFVGGNLISAPTVNEAILGGEAMISGQFTLDEASEMARDLNTGAIPAPIELMGQNTISPSLGALSLEQSWFGMVLGLLALSAFMILYYRVPGVIASLALLAYTFILTAIIRVEWSVFISLSVALLIFFVLNYFILRSKDSGAEKLLAFIVSCFVLFFLTFTLSQAMTLTLAGIAGIVLSIGMAVDANILIFERSKEELAKGKPLQTALDQGFARAWDSIRDSNFSSLITCVILFYFGSSIIRGFALNLALGILVSMFSALTLTRTMLNLSAQSFLQKYPRLFSCGFSSKKRSFSFMKTRKIWFAFSGILMGLSVFAISTLGISFGIDFTGGSAMEFSLKNVPLEKVQENIEGNLIQNDAGNFVLKTQSLDEEALNEIKTKLQSLNPEESLEIIQFNSIGPSIGKSMQQKAWVALAVTLSMIILYIAFAFRNIPKEVSPWRFGVSAIVALVHDLVILLGVMSVASHYFGIEMDALFITALLTMMGFSVHDTIVVFDRLRENIGQEKDMQMIEGATDLALQQTFARSINTSISTLISVVALWIFGPDSLSWFLASLSIGILVGTYSSIFVASPVLIAWAKRGQ